MRHSESPRDRCLTTAVFCDSLLVMRGDDSLPDDVEILKRLLAARNAELAQARAEVSSAEAPIAHLRLTIEKMRRELYGSRSERKARLLDQMELEPKNSRRQRPKTSSPPRGPRHRPRRRRRFVASVARSPRANHSRRIAARENHRAWSDRLRVLRLDQARQARRGRTETLEVVPRQWKVVQYVREKFTCRACERISQAPAPFHVLSRGFAGPSLLAMILFEKYGQHQPLNRQSERYAREGVDLSLSTLADQVGGCAVLLRPLYDRIRAHVSAGSRVLLLARQDRRSPRAPSQRIRWNPSGRRLCRLQPALRGWPQTGADHGGCVLGARPAQVLRAGRYHDQCAREVVGRRAAGARSDQAHRCDL